LEESKVVLGSELAAVAVNVPPRRREVGGGGA